MSLRARFLSRSSPGGSGPFGPTGYYHFLGRGDFEAGQPLSRLTLAEWSARFRRMASRGHSRVWLLVNGYTLAYPSARYPELADPDALSARDPGFLPAIVAAAHENGLKAYAVFTTDGHAAGFAERHPECRSLDRDGRPSGNDAVCLEEPAVREYIETVMEETAGAGWDGAVFHPTETGPSRFNDATRRAYLADTGRDLAAQSDDLLLPWFNRRHAAAVAGWMARWRNRVPGADTIMFNCWWTNDSVQAYRDILPACARICVWDYAWRDSSWRNRPFVRWTESFGPDRIVFMPSSGGYPDHGRPPTDEALRGYDRLLSLAVRLEIRELVWFAGWGTGGEEEERLDLGLAVGCSGALSPPTDSLLDSLDSGPSQA